MDAEFSGCSEMSLAGPARFISVSAGWRQLWSKVWPGGRGQAPVSVPPPGAADGPSPAALFCIVFGFVLWGRGPRGTRGSGPRKVTISVLAFVDFLLMSPAGAAPGGARW